MCVCVYAPLYSERVCVCVYISQKSYPVPELTGGLALMLHRLSKFLFQAEGHNPETRVRWEAHEGGWGVQREEEGF